MKYYQLKRNSLLFIILFTFLNVSSQSYFINEIDSCDLLKNRKNYSDFKKLVDEDDVSILQILFIQVDNPNRPETQSYYLKVDKNNILHKIIITEDKIESLGTDTQRILQNELLLFDSMTNEIKSITTTDISQTIRTPAYLVVKKKKRFDKYFFLNTDIETGLRHLPELHNARYALKFLQKHFDVKFYKILDG